MILLHPVLMQMTQGANHPSGDAIAPARKGVETVSQKEAPRSPDDISVEIWSGISKGMREKHGYPPCAPEWITVIGGDKGDRIFAARIVAEDGCRGLAIQVAALTRSTDSKVRSVAAWLLGEIGDEVVLDNVLPLLSDSDGDVSADALGAFCRLSAVKCKGRLQEYAVAGKSWQMRDRAVRIAADEGVDFSQKVLLAVLDDVEPQVAWRALTTLRCQEVLADQEVRTKITSLMTDPRLWVASAETLERCEIHEAGPQLMTVFREKSSDPANERGLSALISALVKCYGVQAREEIEKFVNSHSSSPGKRNIGSSNVISSLEVAVDALGKVGGPSSEEPLRKALDDPYYRVKIAAMKAIEHLNLLCEFGTELERLNEVAQSPKVREEASRLRQERDRICARGNSGVSSQPVREIGWLKWCSGPSRLGGAFRWVSVRGRGPSASRGDSTAQASSTMGLDAGEFAGLKEWLVEDPGLADIVPAPGAKEKGPPRPAGR